MFEIKHYRPFELNGKELSYQVCTNEDGCTNTVPLVSFVESRLFYQFLLGNADAILKLMADRTYEIELGRSGTVKSTFNVDMAYMRTFKGSVGLDIPVYAYRMNINSFDFGGLENSVRKCAAKKYIDQASDFAEYVDQSPLPIVRECLHATN